MTAIRIIGGGLAGCEAAYQLLKRGYEVRLFEMRPTRATPCHNTDALAELVCSNSLKSDRLDTASGLLKEELRRLDSLLLRCAYECSVPAGGALAVDRERFSRRVEEALYGQGGAFNVIREEATDLDLSIPTIVASGPLTSDALSERIRTLLGHEQLHFYDAVAPIVAADSINYDKAFFAARYGKGDDDYLNCAMNRAQYEAFYDALVHAERVKRHDFEGTEVFEGCMPIEIMASRGADTMRYGPMRPVGIRTPQGDRPYAVVQLRKENVAGSAYNLVGFQTNLLFGEQKRVFSMIPGLERAEFVRYGVMHRNTFLDSPKVLGAGFGCKEYPLLYFAGQITGVEGYMESVASGLIAAIDLSDRLEGGNGIVLPAETIIGQLQRHVSTENADFQPMNANFGILPPLADPKRDKKERKMQYTDRALAELETYLARRGSAAGGKLCRSN